jgi:hypothetical protein
MPLFEYLYLNEDLILARTPILFYCKKSVKKLLLKANQPIPKFLQILLAEYLHKYLT